MSYSSKTPGKHQRAAELLRQRPFNFIKYGRRREVIPKNFKSNGDAEGWAEATAILAKLRSKPATWQWTADRLQHLGGFTDRMVRRGMRRLKADGWVHHVNLYDENTKLLTTFVMVFEEPLTDEKKKGRFSMILTKKGWLLKTPGGSRELVQNSNSNEEEVSVHRPYRHKGSISRTQTLKRASSDSLGCAEAENPISVASPVSENQKPINPVEPPEPPKEELIAKRERITRRLEELGKQKDDSEDAELAYEEFVVTEVIPELTLPPKKKDNEARRKLWCLNWVEESLLGMILLQMSTSPGWNVNCARRIIKRADEGYLQWEDLKSILFAFDWNRGKDNRKTLDAMTFYGKRPDAMDGGRIKTIDGWGLGVKAAKRTYAYDIIQTVKEQRNRLYPDEDSEWAVSHGFIGRVDGALDAIVTGKIDPDEDREFAHSVCNDGPLAYAFSGKPRSAKTQKKIGESHDELVNFMATNYTGILLYKSKGHLIPGALGVELDEVRKAHHEHVDKVSRRMSYHGLSNTEVVPHI